MKTISFQKNNITIEKKLSVGECHDCKKNYISKRDWEIFSNNKSINTMNYKFVNYKFIKNDNGQKQSSLNFDSIIKPKLKLGEQLISLNDDFSKLSNQRPLELYFNKVWHKLEKWSDVFIGVAQELYVINKSIFKELPKYTAKDIDGKLIFKISFDDKVLKKPYKIKNSMLFIDLDISFLELKVIIKQMLEKYKIKENLFVIKTEISPIVIKPKEPVNKIKPIDILYDNYMKPIKYKPTSMDNWMGTGYHTVYLSKNINDDRRHKSRCKYYNKKTQNCRYKGCKCTGSTYCRQYIEKE